jgi:hypothetical protein
MTRINLHFHRFGGARIGFALLAGAVAGCADRALPERDLGNTSALLVDEAPSNSERAPLLVGFDIDPFIEGTWVGSAADPFGSSGPDGAPPAYVFPSGSSDITLELSIPPGSPDEGRFPVGSITFGARPAPEPLAGMPFPPGHDYYSPAFTAFVGVGPVFAPAEGFAYPIRVGVFPVTSEFTNGLLPISYDQNAPFTAWCPLQAALPDGAGSFNCGAGSRGFSGGLPPNAEPCVYLGADDGEEPVDCDLAILCSDEARGGVCECNENGCAALAGRASHLWLVREGDDLIGNFVGTVFQYGNSLHLLPVGSVHFRRVNP